MKKLISIVQCSTLVTLCLGAVTVQAGFVSPRVPPRDNIDPAASTMALRPPPQNPPGVRIVTNNHDDGVGSLRRAISSAAAGDSIKFALPLPATISLSSTLVIAQDVVVLGPGPDRLAVVRSSAPHTPSFRVFRVNAGVVTISGMTIRNGIAFDASSFADNIGGGIYNRGALTVSNCVVTGNSAPSSSSGGTNRFGFGAGIFSDGSQLTLINSTFSGNQASAAGGGICTFETASFFAQGCTVSGNFAAIQGGGLNFQGHVGTLQNCTIASNATAADGAGSGVANVAFEGEAPTILTVTACTVAGNTGTTNGAFAIAGLNDGFGLTNRLLSTLVAANAGPNFAFFGTNITFQSLGNNLDSDGSSGLINGANGDLVGTVASPIDAKLGVLQNNGGPTLTIALLLGSPALGAGACTDAGGAPLLIDQRGSPRPPSTGCDIGAYENEPLTLICPPDVVAEFQNEAGAVVKLKATVIDLCPQVSTVYAPPSGSVFPIGVTPVQVQAADGCSGNSAQCAFTVTVLGAQGVKSNVLANLETLRAGATNPRDQHLLDEAIADMIDALATPLWVDQTHVDAANGGWVFFSEQDAVAELQDLINSRHSQIPDATAQNLINRLVKCDRLLALVSIEDAAAGGANPRRIAQAKKEVANGDKDASAGKPVQAIQHYWNAWSQAVNL